MKFNVNNYVKIRITKAGEEALAKAGHNHLDFERDEDGWVRLQMWCMMEYFGHAMNMYDDCPFETTIIIEDGK